MEFLIISGMSGAGKSRAADVMEDLNYYCVDNLPVALIPRFAELCMATQERYEKVALVMDVRERDGFEDLFSTLDSLKNMGCTYRMLFMDADTATLIKRYKETRRPHPLAGNGTTMEEAIRLEHEMMTPIRARADYVINSTGLTHGMLQQRLYSLFGGDQSKKTITVNVTAFGYKHGIPLDADLVLDVRFLPNPYYEEDLRQKTGLDPEVREYVFASDVSREFMDKLTDLVDFLLPLYIEEGKFSLTIAVGCTGGRHRSVAVGYELRNELCQIKIDSKSYAVAQAYGVLLYCNTFSADEIRIITAADAFAQTLPRLFRKAFNVGFDKSPDRESKGKKSFIITDKDKIRTIYSAFDIDADSTPVLHINHGVLEEDGQKLAFIRGAFLAGGSVSDPEKSYHLEMTTTHASVSREAYAILLDMGFSPKEAKRSGSSMLYFKQSETIADFCTWIGAPVTALKIMNAKVDKDMRNAINRKVNCDSANADKIVLAAQEQLNAIKEIDRVFGLENLPNALHEAALLRIANPASSISDLAKLSIPPVSKSTLNYRLNKLMALQKKLHGTGSDMKPEEGN